MNESFLPEGYEVPKQQSDFMNFKKDGSYKFRILANATIGYEYWNSDRKPVRSRTAYEEKPADLGTDRDGNPEKIKHFWAFPVWNYKEERVQILEITQSTIQTAINDLYIMDDWGDPKGYDITVVRKEVDGFVKYAVQPSPHKPLPGDATKAYEARPLNLDALFDGGNPFEEADGPTATLDATFSAQDAAVDQLANQQDDPGVVDEIGTPALPKARAKMPPAPPGIRKS